MSRYFTKPVGSASRADWDDCYPLLPDLHVPDSQPVDTGLVDIRGAAIMRAPLPIGFGRENEW